MTDVKPLALVVDDMRQARELRIELLEEKGFAVIGASSRRDAERELRACPSIDLLVTDVNLSPTGVDDISGIDLAEKVNEIRPDLPVIGYSGKFEAGQIPRDQLRFFRSVHLRGAETIDKLEQSIFDWRKMALEYRTSRTQRAAFELERLRQKYRIADYDFDLLREYMPAFYQPETVDEVLSNAGFKLEIIEQTPDDVASEGVRIQYPVPVWLRMADDNVTAEVYRFPDLYAGGETEAEAIRLLLLLMAGYYHDLSDSDDVTLSARMVQMRKYLSLVFG